MRVHFDLSNCTLTTEQQAVVDGINKFLAWLPDNQDSTVALRLAMGILEAADVAPQRVLAEAAGLTQDRSVRVYKERLKEQGLAGLFDRPISGRPATTTQTPVEKAFIQVVLVAVIEEHAVPADDVLAERVNHVLREGQASEAGGVTASMIETLRLRWGIQRAPLQQALSAAATQTAEPGPVQLGRTQVGGAFVLAILLVETGGWFRVSLTLWGFETKQALIELYQTLHTGVPSWPLEPICPRKTASTSPFGCWPPNGNTGKRLRWRRTTA